MFKDNVLTINEWYKGTGESPLTGFQSIINCEIFEQKGIVSIANRLTPYITVTGIPMAQVSDTHGNVYTLEGGDGVSGKIYKNGAVLQSGLGTAWDLAVWNDYLFITHGSGSTNISCYGPLSSGAYFFSNWKTGLTPYYYAKLHVRRDGLKMYIGNGNYLASLSSFVAAASGVSPTATLDTGAVTLPPNQFAVTMAELRGYMFIGTQAGTSWQDRNNYRVGSIAIWDKTQGGTLTNAVDLNENAVHALISDGNRIYAVAGTYGNVYVTDSVNYDVVKKIPWVIDRPFGLQCYVYPNAVSFNHSSNLLIGTSSNIGVNQKHGVFEINTSKKTYEAVLKHIISSGNVGDTQALQIGLVKQTAQDTLYVGWQDGASYGLDYTDFRKYTSYSAYMISEMYVVGSRLNRKTFQNIEFALSRPLVSGQGLRISYRSNLNDSFTVIGTWDYSTIGAVSNYIDKALIGNVDKVQLKIELTQSTASASTDNLYLLYIKIW